jgi:hypothetical protein
MEFNGLERLFTKKYVILRSFPSRIWRCNNFKNKSIYLLFLTTFSITTLNKMGLNVTLSVNHSQHLFTLNITFFAALLSVSFFSYAECRYADSCIFG